MNRNETTYMSARGALRRAIGMLCALCMAFLALDMINPAQAQTHVHPSPETMEHLASCVEPEVVDGEERRFRRSLGLGLLTTKLVGASGQSATL